MAPAATQPSPIPASENKDASLRDVQNIVLGDMLFRTWYPSFYPEEIMGKELERLYVCQWCFKYSKDEMPFLSHMVSPIGRWTALSRECALRERVTHVLVWRIP
jgi:hypothetical protein